MTFYDWLPLLLVLPLRATSSYLSLSLSFAPFPFAIPFALSPSSSHGLPPRARFASSSLSFFDPQELSCRGNRLFLIAEATAAFQSTDAFGLREREREQPTELALIRLHSCDRLAIPRASPTGILRYRVLLFSFAQWMSAFHSFFLTTNNHHDGRHSIKMKHHARCQPIFSKKNAIWN